MKNRIPTFDEYSVNESFNIGLNSHNKLYDDLINTLRKHRSYVNSKDMIECLDAVKNALIHDTMNESEILEKEFSEEKRKELADKGFALPDGSFPIESEQDLKNAIHAVGRSKHPDKAKAHIIKRAKAMGKESLLPENW